MLWGGETWQTMGKLGHNGVKLIDFSPNENYLVTVNPPEGHHLKEENVSSSSEYVQSHEY